MALFSLFSSTAYAADPVSTPESNDIAARGARIASAIKSGDQSELSSQANNSDTEDTPLYENLNEAIEIHDVNSMLSARDEEGRTIYGVLPTIEDVEEYPIEIDHSILPEVTLYAFCRHATGNAKIEVLDGSKVVKTLRLVNRPTGYASTYWPKAFGSIENLSGEVKAYTIRVTTDTGNAAYAITLGTKDTFVEDYGGSNYATVAKNIPSEIVAATGDVGYFPGARPLLNSGEWFHYVADGNTYITAYITGYNNLAFVVIDIEAETAVYTSTKDDCGIEEEGAPTPIGYVARRVDLVPGKEYLIGFYCTSTITSDLDDTYGIRIGLPMIVDRKFSTSTSASYSIPANTTKRFVIEVSGLPDSARAGLNTTVAFNSAKNSNDICITDCVITDPNGNKFKTPMYGKYYDFTLDPIDYWGRHNTPLNGRWTVDIKASQAMSGLKFRIMSHYVRILGREGD